MNMKLKALGLGFLLAGAMSAMEASAAVTGHFTHDASNAHALLVGKENPTHKVKIRPVPEGTWVECEESATHGTLSTTTVTSLTVASTPIRCQTEGGVADEVVIDMNGCHYVFFSNTNASTHTPTTHATVSIVCPAGKAIVLTHPNCEITITAQSNLKGLTYTTLNNAQTGKHELTIRKTVNFALQRHGGICIFLGTADQGEFGGSTTLKATDTAGAQVHLTAT